MINSMHAQRYRETSCVCRTNSYDSRTNSYGSRATIARHLQLLINICPSPTTLRTRTSFARLPYEFMRLPYDFVRQPCALKSRKQIVRQLGVSNSSLVRCEFVRQPYDLLQIPCDSNRKPSQDFRAAGVGNTLRIRTTAVWSFANYCESNPKRSQGCRLADVNNALVPNKSVHAE